MPETSADTLNLLVHNVDADDVARELEKIDADKRDNIWDLAISSAKDIAPDTPRKERLRYVLQVLVALAPDRAQYRRLETRKVLAEKVDCFEGPDRQKVTQVIKMIERKEKRIWTFSRYEALAMLVKYGNLYWEKDDRDSTLWQPKGDEARGFVSAEDVEWLVMNGLADHADYDPMLVKGKVLPTEKAPKWLRDHGLTRESPGVGTHLSHCCITRHGCKYGDEFCPVETKMYTPDSETCGACYEDDAMDTETAGYLPDHILINELESRGYTVSIESDESDESDDRS